MKQSKVSAQESVLINAIRFPLIVLVLLIHVLPGTCQTVSCSLSGVNVYCFASELVSHNLGRIAVPCFFVISGYLFFHDVYHELTIAILERKWKNRFSSLLIPYLFWNFALVVITLLKDSLFYNIGLGHDEGVEMIKNIGIYGCMWGVPVNFPLWYLRDLICMTVIAPILFYGLKKLSWGGLIIIYIYYLTSWEFPMPGFSSTALFYFSLGAYCGIYGKSMYAVVKKTGKYCLAFTSIALILLTLSIGNAMYELAIRICIPFMMIAFAYLVNLAIAKDYVLRLFTTLSSSVFFIYASHEIFILNWSKGIVLRVFGDGLLGMWMKYLLVPAMVLSICILLYKTLKIIAPRTLSFICGQRI